MAVHLRLVLAAIAAALIGELATAQTVEIRADGVVSEVDDFYAFPANLWDVSPGESMSLTVRFAWGSVLNAFDHQASGLTVANLTMTIGDRVASGAAPIHFTFVRAATGGVELLRIRFVGDHNWYDTTGSLFQESGDAELFSLFAGLPSGTLPAMGAPLTSFETDGPFLSAEEILGGTYSGVYGLLTESLAYAVPHFGGSTRHAKIVADLTHISLDVIPAPSSCALLLICTAMRRRRSASA